MSGPSDLPVDELIALGLYDPDAPGADARLIAFGTALRLGATTDDLLEFKGNISDLVAVLLLRGGRGRYTLEEVAELAGASLERVRVLNRVSGFAEPKPDARIFDDDDVEIFRLFEGACDVFGEELVLQLTRVMGSAMGRVAETMVSAFAVNAGTAGRMTTFDDAEFVQMNEMTIALLPSAVRVMDVLLRKHIQIRTRSTFDFSGDSEGVDAIDRAIGFCDLVGYTSLTESLSARELALLVADFENLASDVVTDGGGSVVKLIGDEVMYVAPDAAAGADIGLRLVDEFEHSDLPSVRVGLASGRVLLREGDYYGAVVNLAARIVKLAQPGGVLAPATFRDAVGDAVVYEDAGAPVLKGFENPVGLLAMRRS